MRQENSEERGSQGTDYSSGYSGSDTYRDLSSNEKMEYGVPPKTPYYNREAGVDYGSSYVYGDGGSEPQKTNKKAVFKAFFLPFLIGGGIALALWKAGAFDAVLNAGERKTIAEKELGENRDRQKQQGETKAASDERQYPNSAFFKQLVIQIFQDTPENIAKSGYESVSSLLLDPTEDDFVWVTYTLSDGTSDRIALYNLRTDYADLQCFPGLQKIDIGEEEFETGDLSGLSNLKSIGSGMTAEELKGVVDDPLTITELTFYGAMLKNGTSGLEEYASLEQLSFYTKNLPDLEPAANLPGLKELTVELPEHGAAQDGFQTLYRMTGLTSLHLNSSYVKDIGFIENMKNLKELTLINADITDLDILLTRKDTLEKLVLWHIFGVSDYSPVFELTDLDTLGIELWMADELPSMAEFSNLKTLAVGKVEKLDAVGELTGLEELALINIYDGELLFLPNLKNVKKLWVTETSVFEEGIPAIAGMEKVEELILDDSFIWTDMSPLFAMPKLRHLSLDDAEAGIDFSKVSDNLALESLHMNKIILDALVDGKWNYGQEEKLYLSDYPDFFTHFPQLKELYAANCGLTDMMFVKELSELSVLDLSDNRLNALLPAEELPESLTMLRYEGNPIAEDGGYQERMDAYMDTINNSSEE